MNDDETLPHALCIDDVEFGDMTNYIIKNARDHMFGGVSMVEILTELTKVDEWSLIKKCYVAFAIGITINIMRKDYEEFTNFKAFMSERQKKRE